MIKEKLGKPVFALHAGPESMEDAPNLPPMFLGRKPVATVIGRTFYRILKVGVDRMVNRPLQTAYNQVLADHGVEPIEWSVLDETVRARGRRLPQRGAGAGLSPRTSKPDRGLRRRLPSLP